MRISLARGVALSHGAGFGVVAGAQPGAAQPTAPRTASAAALHHGRGLVCVAAVVAAAASTLVVAATVTSAPALMAIGRRTAGTAVAAAAAYSRRRRCCDSSTVCEELPRCTTVAQELRAELLGSARFDRRVRWAV